MMKKIANSLMKLAALVLFGACLVTVFDLLVVLMASVGFADWAPVYYYQRLNIPLISVALPIVGMILFAAFLLLLPSKPADAVVLNTQSSPPSSIFQHRRLSFANSRRRTGSRRSFGKIQTTLRLDLDKTDGAARIHSGIESIYDQLSDNDDYQRNESRLRLIQVCVITIVMIS
ncbi:MAG TPA: hypothetical protein VFV58_03890 [Blastocatellia bacterium]|jgi:hypothetical protein|nr:hypothetical protein [Blastocatellia bacterium]